MTTPETEFKDTGGIDGLSKWIKSISDNVDPTDHDDHSGDDPSIDIRLRYHDGSWFTYSGSSDYDQDHRGSWGCSCVIANMTMDNCRDTAIDLKEQVLEQIAESVQ